MKDTLVAGDSLDFVTSVPDYTATDGYTLKYRLMPRVSGTPIAITASAEGSDYRVLVAPATTAAWTAGEYSWASWVEKSGERYTVSSGLTTIVGDPAVLSAYDGRSQAEVALADAQTALANFNATGGRVRRYAIAGREMEFDAAGDLIKLVSYWQGVVNRETAAAALRNGLADPRRIYIRMGNA